MTARWFNWFQLATLGCLLSLGMLRLLMLYARGVHVFASNLIGQADHVGQNSTVMITVPSLDQEGGTPQGREDRGSRSTANHSGQEFGA